MFPKALVPTHALLLAAAGGVALVIGLAMLVGAGMTDAFDRTVIDEIRAPALHDLLSPLQQITELGSTSTVTAVALIAVLVGALAGHWRHGLVGAITILFASIGNSLFKLAIARARPDLLEPVIVEHGFSFPSGHSALGMVAYGVLAVLVSRSSMPTGVKRVLVFALGALVVLIGISRIWLGVHFPTDVLAGWTAGAVLVLVFSAVTRRVSPGPAAEPADGDPAARRSDPPVAG